MANKQIDMTAVRRAIVQKSLYEFVKYFWDTFDGAPLKELWLMEYQAECFQYSVRHFLPEWVKEDWLSDDEYYQLKLEHDGECPMRDHPDRNNHDWNMPPRHSKSTTHNVVGPVWLNTIVAKEIASVSHIQDLATDFNIKRQKILKSNKFKELFGHDKKLQITKSTAKEITLKNGGKLFSVGMTNFTGFGADMIINDDIVSSEHAKKDKEVLANARSYWTNTMPTRRNQGDDTIIWNIMQRLAPGDVSGMIEEDEELSTQYTKTVVRAIAEKDTAIIFPCTGKVHKIKKGEPLWPDRFGNYENTKRLVGAGTFETQYQQNPINSEMTYIKQHQINWITYDEYLSKYPNPRKYASFDFPVKGKDESDFTGVVYGHKARANLAIVDALEEKMGYKEQKAYVTSLYKSSQSTIQIYEDKANGSVLLQDLKNDIPGLQEFEPGSKSKDQRLDIASNYMGNIDFVLDEDGNKPKTLIHLIRMLTSFPFVKHDDVVDAFSQLIIYLYSDVELKIYGLQFDENNIIDQYDPAGKALDIAISKRGNVWKLLDIVQDYARDEFVAINEHQYVGSSSEIIPKVLEHIKGKRQVYEVGEEIYAMMMRQAIIQPNVFDFQKSIISLRNGFVKNKVKIMRHCEVTINDIETFRYSKESVRKREPKPLTQDDGFAGCLRVAITSNKGENAIFY